MIADNRKFFMGAGLLVGFVVVLGIMFSPVFDGRNALKYMDALYNSISKGSAYYIPHMKGEASGFAGKKVEVSMKLDEGAERVAGLLRGGGISASADGDELTVRGDLAEMMQNCLMDAEAMYRNDGDKVSKRHGYEAKRALYDWWKALQGLEAGLKGQKRFKEAKLAANIKKKAVEPAYNYYGIEPQSIKDRLGIIIFSLIFYVIYTVWYGFSILFMFEGWGLRLGH